MLEDGRAIDRRYYERVVGEELDQIRDTFGVENINQGEFQRARQLLDLVATSDQFIDFLTLAAYDQLE